MESRVLFTLSSLSDIAIREFLQSNNLPYLVKPFEVSALIAAARRLLQKEQAGAAAGD
jgi:DNA-binding response OmpR family regulator